MTFTSLSYVLFTACVFILFRLVPMRLRWLVLLVASYIFYATLKTPYLLLALATVTSVSYSTGLLLNSSESEKARKIFLWTGIGINLALLVCLKYLPFLSANMNVLFAWLSTGHRLPIINDLVTVGVSFYVFQGISYISDVYLNVIEPETHPGYFALYMGFFPKLLQGPIERGNSLLPQIRENESPSWADMGAGLHLFLWGMFKKVAIADRLATFVDPVYGNVTGHDGLSLLLATYLFAFQLYLDFSGYTDMALGVARCFNIQLTRNFNSPYLSGSVSEFWRRWHISFSSWILDYIFKPLQFSFRDWKTWGAILALIITFLSSGLWHGASWCFIAWGAIHGLYLSGAVLFRQEKKRFRKMLGVEEGAILKVWRIAMTFNLVCFSWIFFRAKSIQDALYVAWNAVAGIPHSFSLARGGKIIFFNDIFGGRTFTEVAGVAILLLLLSAAGIIDRRINENNSATGTLSWLDILPFWSRGFVYGFLCYLIVFRGVSTQSFIYQQF